MALLSNNSVQNQITKLQSRLENALSQRRFYDAHQIIRTLQTRMLQKQINVNDPNSEANVEELLELIYNCCLTFCKENEFSSAIDLAELYVDTCKSTARQLVGDRSDKLVQLFTKLPGKLEGEEINSDDKDSETFDSDKSLPKDRRTPFLNKTLDWALKNTGGCPDLLNSVVLLQQRFAKVLENEGRKQQAERLNKAADWLVKEINRKMQSTSGTSHSSNKEEMTGEQQINQTGQGVSDIDLD
uniref:Uncharacterized protein n=1 Tax=Meloidogyne incognita TaxID=6306 RepID=A0A914L4Q6_MELIC